MARPKKSIYSALISNILIAIIKFVAGGISNSAAMIAEGVHSLVDTVNELLLLYGIKQSRKPPDADRPFGYGKDLYFWSFIVSILIFGLGGGVSIYQGWAHIRHPAEVGNPFWNYVVIGFSIVFEGISFFIASKEFGRVKGEQGWWAAIKRSKDPTSFLVLFEDGAAVLGLLIVLLCLWLGQVLHNPYLDGVASCLVGLLLVAVSIILARESRSLLMGEGIAPETHKKIQRMVEADPAVVKLMHLLSNYQSPETVVLMMIVAFKKELGTVQIDQAIERIRDHIKKAFPLIRFILVQPDVYEEKL
ncbi:MAG: cation diffusion facilitator family transporter [Flavisolibacter sp.]